MAVRKRIGSVQAVVIDLATGAHHGAADPRRDGTVIQVRAVPSTQAGTLTSESVRRAAPRQMILTRGGSDPLEKRNLLLRDQFDTPVLEAPLLRLVVGNRL